MSRDHGFIEWLGGLALGAWIGGIGTIAIAAPAVFHTLGEDRQRAGETVGAILDGFRRLEFLCAGAVLLGAILLVSRPPSSRDIARVAIAALMAAFLAGYAFWIAPALREMRPQIHTFDLLAAEDPSLPRRHFDSLHRLYTNLSTANLLLGLALWMIWKKPPPDSKN